MKGAECELVTMAIVDAGCLTAILFIPKKHHSLRGNHEAGPDIKGRIDAGSSFDRRVCDVRPEKTRLHQVIATQRLLSLQNAVGLPFGAIGFHPVLDAFWKRIGPTNGIIDDASVDTSGYEFANV